MEEYTFKILRPLISSFILQKYLLETGWRTINPSEAKKCLFLGTKLRVSFRVSSNRGVLSPEGRLHPLNQLLFLGLFFFLFAVKQD